MGMFIGAGGGATNAKCYSGPSCLNELGYLMEYPNEAVLVNVGNNSVITGNCPYYRPLAASCTTAIPARYYGRCAAGLNMQSGGSNPNREGGFMILVCTKP